MKKGDFANFLSPFIVIKEMENSQFANNGMKCPSCGYKAYTMRNLDRHYKICSQNEITNNNASSPMVL